MNSRWTAVIAAGCVVAGGVGVGGQFASGSVYSALHAREMIDALSTPALYLGGAIASSSATTMALMLTLLGLVRQVDSEFDQSLYRRVYWISLLSAFLLGGSVIMLLLMTMPIGEFDEIPQGWFPALYQVLYWLVVSLSAMVVAMVALLFTATRTLIGKVTPHDVV